MLASCVKQEAMLSPDKASQGDSLALQVAVLPVLNCLPVYYAQRLGLADSLGLSLRLHRFQAQMDIDTALLNKRVDIAASDLIRALRLWNDSTQVRAFMATDEPISLLALKGKRVSKVHQLKEKMVAVARLSITDYWCDQMVDSTEVSHSDFYRPQVNDVTLRTEMLRTGLMDAAILPEPYAAWMKAAGHKELKRTDEKSPRLAAWVARGEVWKDSLKASQLKSFRQVYDNAVSRIRSGIHSDTLRAILVQEYHIPPQALDSLSLPQVSPSLPLRPIDAETATRWLRSRGRLPKAALQDSLFLNL